MSPETIERLNANGWRLVQATDGYRFYERYIRDNEGDDLVQWIELEPDGCGYFGIGNLRISNGTWDSIVERFIETPPGVFVQQ